MNTFNRFLLLAVCLFFSINGFANTVTLKIATLTPDGSAWMNAMRKGNAIVEKRTEGRVKFKFYPGGVMGDDKSVMRKIRIGQLHGGALTSGAFATVYPDGQIYNLPLSFKSFEQVDYVRQKMDPILMKGYEENGFVTFGFSEGGLAYPMTSADPMYDPGDFNQRKVWIPNDDEMSAISFSAVGVTPIPLAIGDVLAGLQTSLVDTIVTPPIPTLVMQWHSQVTSLTDYPMAYIFGIMAVSKKAFSKISEADQAIVREVMEKVFADLDKLNRQDGLNAFEALKAQGVEVITLSDEKRALWDERGALSQEKLKTKLEFSPEIYQMFQELLQDDMVSD